MASKNDVDFLVDIMKSRTAARQQRNAAGGYDGEGRDGPPETHSYEFDYYGNRIQKKPHPRPAGGDYGEFLDVPPGRQPAGVEPGCVAEFGQCLKVSFCCASDGDNYAVYDDAHEMTQEDVMRELSDDLRALRASVLDAKSAKAMREFELRAELAEVQRRSSEMEQSYHRSIAREMSQRVLLQAQLQSRLRSIMAERIAIENQLGRLPPAGDGQEKRLMLQNGNAGTSGGNNSCALVPLTVTRNDDGMSPLSALCDHPTTPADSAAIVNELMRVPIEPPAASNTYSEPKSIQRSAGATPFGLPVLEENADHDHGSEDSSILSKGANKSKSFSPVPPTSNRSSEAVSGHSSLPPPAVTTE